MARMTSLFYGAHTRAKAHLVLVGSLALVTVVVGFLVLIAGGAILSDLHWESYWKAAWSLLFLSLLTGFLIYCYYSILDQYFAALARLKRRGRRYEETSPW